MRAWSDALNGILEGPQHDAGPVCRRSGKPTGIPTLRSVSLRQRSPWRRRMRSTSSVALADDARDLAFVSFGARGEIGEPFGIVHVPLCLGLDAVAVACG